MNEIVHLLNPWWRKEPFDKGIVRHRYKKLLEKTLTGKRATLIVGSRRVGKTTLLRQIIHTLLSTVSEKHILYLLLDHPKLSRFTIMDLVSEYRSHFQIDRKTKIYLFLDEVQFVSGWEQEVKAILDTENVKIFLSGSASSELLTKKSFLTGRVETHIVSPLNFSEFLEFNDVRVEPTETYKYKKLCDDYLVTGGYPEYVLEKNPAYFADLINDVLYKDIIRVYDLKNPDVLKDLLLLLADRTGHQATFNKLAAILSVKNDTIKEYIYYLKNTFLISELPRFAASRAKRIYAAKKYYISDNGMLYHLLARASLGTAFEQTVYRHFHDTSESVSFYYENQREVDFVVTREGTQQLWEAKYATIGNLREEVNKYLPVVLELKKNTLHIVTADTETSFTKDGISIEAIPLWKLLLRQNRTL